MAAAPPTVLDVRCDPNVPPIPPHATFEQAKVTWPRPSCAATRTRWGFIKQGIKQKVQQYLPGRRKKDRRRIESRVRPRLAARCPHRAGSNAPCRR